MAEGIQGKRRHSSAIIHKNLILSNGANPWKEKEDDSVSPLNFDENYLMFGGDKYNKDVSSKASIGNADLIKSYNKRFKDKLERHRRMSCSVTELPTNKSGKGQDEDSKSLQKTKDEDVRSHMSKFSVIKSVKSK
mmetsp:Transcript_26882/g.23731  ORF Transcript_26882/g.23731 Transcript_26882/m.23731 type:complete len:135 (+) Transcript_26882:337-741(+)